MKLFACCNAVCELSSVSFHFPNRQNGSRGALKPWLLGWLMKHMHRCMLHGDAAFYSRICTCTCKGERRAQLSAIVPATSFPEQWFTARALDRVLMAHLCWCTHYYQQFELHGEVHRECAIA